MKILFTIGAFGQGGKERRMISLIEYLSGRNVELAIIANERSPNLPRVAPLCQKVYDYRTGQCRFNIREHKEAVRSFGPDLIHSWNGSNTLYALLAAREREQCRVITSEITNCRYLPLLSKEYWVTRLNFHLSDTVLSNSAAGLEAKLAPRRKARVIYNGYQLSRLETIDLEKYRKFVVPGKLNVVMAARFSREKDFATVLRVAAMAQREGLRIHFALAGDGPTLESMRSKAARMQLANLVFTGHLADIDNLLCHMDAGILATDARYHQEGIPNSVVEYMAHGMPALVSRGAAVPEIIKDGENGFVVREGDPGHLLQRLRELAANPERTRRMGENGYRTVKERFNLEEMGERFIRLYRQLTHFS